MGRKGKNSSFELRQLVVSRHEKGRTHRDIARMLNIERSTVGDIMRRYEGGDRIEFIPQKGRPKKLRNRDVRSIIRKVKKNPRLRAPQLAADLASKSGKNVHPGTVRKFYNGRGTMEE
ncbi:hypothetical protein ANN_13232 [Periplaneta americana]|uniref:Uncharacterized protein n=1 Tax=Periplaneta americana TaxID=6978 RepID=A0ABQ8TKV8_PERAM|nr:hypothetical protein ANN_13232 [Periplaneta americana]